MEIKVKIGTCVINIVYHQNAVEALIPSMVCEETQNFKNYELKEKGYLKEGILDLTEFYTLDGFPSFYEFVKDLKNKNPDFEVIHFIANNLITIVKK